MARLQAADPDHEEIAGESIQLHNRLGDYYAGRRRRLEAAAHFEAVLVIAERLHSPTAARLRAQERAKLDALRR